MSELTYILNLDQEDFTYLFIYSWIAAMLLYCCEMPSCRLAYAYLPAMRIRTVLGRTGCTSSESLKTLNL